MAASHASEKYSNGNTYKLASFHGAMNKTPASEEQSADSLVMCCIEEKLIATKIIQSNPVVFW